MINVIDTDAYEASGIEVFQFPGGEWHANVPTWQYPNVHVFAKLRSWDDIGKMLVVVSALLTQDVRVDLFCPYLPGARQDRNPGGNTPATAGMVAWILQGYAQTVTAVDVHSALAAKEYTDLRTINPVTFLKDLIPESLRPDVVIAPDQGAVDRAADAATLFGCYVARAGKVRDFDTGKLTGFTAPQISNVGKDARVLLVDDICDGGGTFVGLLEELRKNHDGPVDLFVTHGIFSRGMEVLNGFDNVYTTDSFWRRSDEVTRPGDVGIKWPHTIGLLPYYFGGLHP